MLLFDKDPDEELIVIAEIGVNHEGNVVKAVTLMAKALDAGADAVKFQYGMIDGGPEQKGGRFALDEYCFREIVRLNEKIGCPIFASALSVDAIPLCDELFPVIKIASRGCKDEELIRVVAKTKKPVIMSTGGSSMNEILLALSWFQDVSYEINHVCKPILLHCVSQYPTPMDKANIKRMLALRTRTRNIVGYSNHCIGPEACYAAVAHGARVIEVHFTDDKTREFRDHQLSFDYSDLKNFIPRAHKIRASL